VDGEPWRTVPDAVVVRCGLRADLELDRPLLRRLRRELREAEALTVAGRSLRRRDLSTRRLAERLEKAGVAPAAERSALQALTDARVLDDARLAEARASSLAERGWGDAAIAARLEAEGIAGAMPEARSPASPRRLFERRRSFAGSAAPRPGLSSRAGVSTRRRSAPRSGGWTRRRAAG